jgi:transcriptional regulator with XRE-family HTH domain
VTLSSGSTARKPRAPVDLAGAEYTRRLAAAVRSRRGAKDWTHAELAGRMSDAGVPWTRETAINLERGRKRSIGAHEVLALTFVLDMHSPVDLLAPGDELLPVAGLLLRPADVRAWFKGDTGPLRAWIAAHGGPPPSLLESIGALYEQAERDPEAAATLRRIARLLHGRGAAVRELGRAQS